MFEIFVALAMMIISAALTAAMTPKQEQTPTEAGKLDVPTADEGGPIPVVFGTCVLKNSNIIWYGDASTQPIYSQAGGKK